MGIFDCFHKQNPEPQPTAPSPRKDWPATLGRIAGIISHEDKAVLAAVAELTADPAAYCEAHGDAYAQRFITSGDDPDLIQWIGLVDILEGKFLCERDWTDEWEDFCHFVGKLPAVAEHGLPLPELDPERDVPFWCKELDRLWAPMGMCMGCIDIDSDSYVLFACSPEELAQLRRLAESLGHSINAVS